MKKIIQLLFAGVITATTVSAQAIEQVSYIGALEADPTKDWTTGWTNFNPQNTIYAVATDDTSLNAISTGNGGIKSINGTRTLNAGSVYLLKGLIVVRNGGKLIIPAGTLIRAEADINASPKNYASILVERGGQIEINGTESKPVVITSNKGTGARARGDWGGIVISGKAKNNQSSDNQVEGFNNVTAEPTLARGGGSDDNDNSGSITYLRMEFGGLAFEPNKEINGLTLNSVGKSTTLHHIQNSFVNDDGFEWFGGNVNAKYLISYRNTDDDFDTDFGWGGAVQFGIAVRDTTQYDLTYNAPSGASTSETFESDNDAAGSGKTPYTRGVFSNMTVIGPVPIGSTYSALGSVTKAAFRRGARIRRNSRLSIINSVFMGYRNFLMYDGDSTLKAAGVRDSVFPESMLFRNNLIVNTAAAASTGSTNTGLVEVATANASLRDRFDGWVKAGINANRVNTVAYTSGTVLVDPQNPTTPNFRPSTGSPANSGSNFNFSLLNTWGVINGVNTINSITQVNLYPNPASDKVMVDFASKENFSASVKMIDLSGKTIKTFGTAEIKSGINNLSLNIEGLNTGIYMLVVEAGNGRICQRFIKN
jgi:hypothetical protein